MDALTIDLWTFDVGAEAESPEAFARLMSGHILKSWDGGADVAMFPEYSWMGIDRFVEGGDKLRGVAELFWRRLWPGLQRSLAAPDKAAVLGTAPFATDDGKLRNRAVILRGGVGFHQDKLCLTPWEREFSPGDSVNLWSFKGAIFAVLVCLDIEVPEISAALRGRGVDAVLVPSATENVLGVERVNRCASARAVELGCCVGVCHLVGKSLSGIVDENVGSLGWYAPSQSPFANRTRDERTALEAGGFHCRRVVLEPKLLAKARNARRETNPALLKVTQLPKVRAPQATPPGTQQSP